MKNQNPEHTEDGTFYSTNAFIRLYAGTKRNVCQHRPFGFSKQETNTFPHWYRVTIDRQEDIE